MQTRLQAERTTGAPASCPCTARAPAKRRRFHAPSDLFASSAVALIALLSPSAALAQNVTVDTGRVVTADEVITAAGDIVISGTGTLDFQNGTGTSAGATAGGTISNAGTITDSGSGTTTLTGTLTNLGTLTKGAGSGVLNITGDIANSGLISIAASSGSTIILGNVTQAGGATFNATGSTSISGTLTNAGAGSLLRVDSASFTVSGGVTNSAGKVEIGTDGNLTANVINADELVNSGILTGNVTNTAGTTTNNGDITGTVQIDGGSVINNATGEIVGLITVGSGGSLTNNGTVGDVTNGGAFVNNADANAGTVTITGTGGGENGGTIESVIHESIGIFTNNNEITGAVEVSDGRFNNSGSVGGTLDVIGGNFVNNAAGTVSGITTIGAEGHVENSGELGAVSNAGNFVNNATGVAGAVTNTGAGNGQNDGEIASLTHASTGVFENLGTITGTTTVQDGTVLANGTMGTTLVQGGTLGGFGTVGDTTIAGGGTLAPGYAGQFGSLTVDGNLTFEDGSTYLVKTNNGGNVAGVNNDITHVTGDLVIADGAVVSVVPQPGAYYLPGTTYTILTYDGTLTGAFNSEVDEDLAFLDGTVEHEAGSVLVTMDRNDVAFSDVAETRNQRAVAGALETFPDYSLFYMELIGLTEQQARDAYDSMSGEVHIASQHLLGSTFGLFRDTLGRTGGSGMQSEWVSLRMGYTDEDGQTSAAEAADFPGLAPVPVGYSWVKVIGGLGSVADDGNAAELDWSAGGMAAGYEVASWVAGGEAVAGFGLGAISSGATIDDRASSIATNAIYLGGYGNWTDGTLSFSGRLAYGANQISTTREITPGNTTETAEADYWAQQLGLDIEASHSFWLGEELRIAPLVTASIGWLGHDTITETGADTLGATIAADQVWQMDIGIGTEVSHSSILDDGSRLDVHARVALKHRFGESAPTGMVTLLAGGPAFEIAGAETERSRVVVGTGFTWSPIDNLRFSLTYNGEVSASAVSHGVNIGVNGSF